MSDPHRPVVSVVVSTRNRASRLPDLLTALRAQTLQREAFEVVIVDNGSSDATSQLLEAELRRGELSLRTRRLEPGGGVGHARNLGWRLATAPLIAFTDDDCVPTSGWLAAGFAAARANPGAIVQGPTEPRPDERHQLGPFSRTLEVHELGPWYPTCNMFYPRELLERIGGFDTDAFDFVGDDTDLAWRALDAGAEAVWAPDALNRHAVSPLGPLGTLRLAARWTPGVNAFARHRDLRKALIYGVFWKHSHLLLVRALLALALPTRLGPLPLASLRAWLALPYLRALAGRSGRRQLFAVPLLAVHDLVELSGMVRGSIRYRTLVL